jgi:aryl sulfotransferase
MSATVWLASYPRSGSTWTRAVLSALTGPAGPVDINALRTGLVPASRAVMDAVLGFASSDLLPDELAALRPVVDAEVDAGSDRVTVRKVHDALFSGPDGRPIVDPGITRAAIYLVRDPRDVAVSLAAFYGRPAAWAVDWMANPDAALADTDGDVGADLRQRLGTWSAHVDGWTGQHLFPVEVFQYEDLHADPIGQFGRLAAVVGLTTDRAHLAAAVSAARFERLRDQEIRHGFRERPATDRPFFRRGVVGAWRYELPADLVGRIEVDHATTMDAWGYGRGAIYDEYTQRV